MAGVGGVGDRRRVEIIDKVARGTRESDVGIKT